MHLGNRAQRFGEHGGLFVRQWRQVFDGEPSVGQALGPLDKFKQQPTALAVLQAIGQQQRCGQALLSQQAYTCKLTLKMPRRLAAHQQLGQHRATPPHGGAHIALPWQHPQQAQQLQLPRAGGIRQVEGQWQAGGTPSRFQLG